MDGRRLEHHPISSSSEPLVNTNKHNDMNSLLYNCYLHFTDTEGFKFMYTLWKARILALYGQPRWSKPENLGKQLI